ncbi:hypothetical protein SAMN02799625_02598 [Methylobacterium sp. UNC300MFChir4.1]|nr:hypothetical protein SAMN02799625_02598 [Methylobacterium sp. UNC300MFChir4.1]
MVSFIFGRTPHRMAKVPGSLRTKIACLLAHHAGPKYLDNRCMVAFGQRQQWSERLGWVHTGRTAEGRLRTVPFHKDNSQKQTFKA